MPDSDGDGISDDTDPCPSDVSNTCFNACLSSEMTPSFFEGAVCLGIAAGIVGGIVASGGGIAALGSALAASLGMSGYAGIMSGIVAGTAAVGTLSLTALCACMFHVFG